MSYQQVYPLHAYADNDLVENLGPMGLVLRSAKLPEMNAGVPVNAVAATGILTAADTPHTGDTVKIGVLVYTFRTALTEAKATGTFTLADVPDDGDFCSIGPVGYEQVYTFKTALTSATAANEVLIEASASDTLDNLIVAINAGTGGGTKYGSDTAANSYVTAAAGAGDTMTVTAKEIGTEYNLVLTDADNHGSWGDANLTGGLDAVANEVLIDGASNSLDHLVLAVTGGAEEGTSYSTGTVAHTLVTAAAGAGDTLTFTALVKGTAGNAISTPAGTGSGHLTWNHAHLGGAGATAGVDGTVALKYEMYIDVSNSKLWIATADNTAIDANWKYISFTG